MKHSSLNTTQALDDDVLVRTIQDGSGSTAAEAAVDELLGRYHRKVYLHCFRYVREHHRAMDLCQNVMIDVLRGLPGFAGRSGFSLWIFAITRNRCLSEIRRPEPVVDAEFDLDLFHDQSVSPVVRLEESEAEKGLLELIDKTLDPTEQKAIWLRCMEKLPVDEITEMLGIEAHTGARSILQRARRKLRAALEKRRLENAG